MTDTPLEPLIKYQQSISLNFSQPELGMLLAKSKPPQGVKVSKPTYLVQCSAPAEIFLTVVISFATGIPSSLIEAWIYDRLKNSTHKSSRINRQQITFSQQSIRRLIDKQIADEKARNAQWAKEHKQTQKKRG